MQHCSYPIPNSGFLPLLLFPPWRTLLLHRLKSLLVPLSIPKTTFPISMQVTTKSSKTCQGSSTESLRIILHGVNRVYSRFILNLPDEELASLERICFQVEQACASVT